MEKCANCGSVIGDLETPRVWSDRVVCGDCHKKLRGRGRLKPLLILISLGAVFAAAGFVIVGTRKRDIPEAPALTQTSNVAEPTNPSLVEAAPKTVVAPDTQADFSADIQAYIDRSGGKTTDIEELCLNPRFLSRRRA
jgi:hypothetical protein